MDVKLSRHAKRRAKLYKISEKTIIEALQNQEVPEGKNTLICKLNDVEFPVKIIYLMKNEMVTIITNYPLKKGAQK